MTPLKSALCLICYFVWTTVMASCVKLSVRQERRFIPANVGGNVTLECFYEDDVASMFYWYKQVLGHKPRLISVFYKHDKNGTFNHEFKNNPRFSLETKNGNNHLTISDLRKSDSATYYCVSCHTYKFKFGEGATVSVEGSGLNIPALVHQSVSGTIQPGGCTVHTGTCDVNHSVYWFSDSQPGIVYIHGDKDDPCGEKLKTQTHSCAYDLPVKSPGHSHTASHCAVATCGHILFGNRTNLEFEDEVDSLVLVYVLSGALALTTTLTVVLAFSVYTHYKAKSCKCPETQADCSAPFTGNTKCQDADNLHYAALKGQGFNRPTRQRDDTLTHCVYSTVRQSCRI
ncbi:hypothetical protein Q5P01_002252 [Channa striata]|uniref:Ig-like domain-containing protein n=1 Tax=Channa striata TaxID=64152 RepID=A0AA88NU04_CHASR|nr:hypothetical protein Q5P01_002252 [Channa striata]